MSVFDLMFDKSKFYLFVNKDYCVIIKNENNSWIQKMLPDIHLGKKIQPTYVQFDTEEELTTKLTLLELIN